MEEIMTGVALTTTSYLVQMDGAMLSARPISEPLEEVLDAVFMQSSKIHHV